MCGRVSVYMYAYNTDINAQVVRYHVVCVDGVCVDMYAYNTDVNAQVVRYHVVCVDVFVCICMPIMQM